MTYMDRAQAKIRLHVAGDLDAGGEVVLGRDQAHYLFGVMRQAPGDAVRLFNGRDGEWLAEIAAADRRHGLLRCVERTMAQTEPPDLWLLFAPIKKARTDFVAEKAAELGCRRLVPVFTAHTNAERVNTARLHAHAVEAAEQCGLVSVPDVAEPVALTALLEDWPAERQILFCDETGPRPPAAEVLRRADAGPWAVLTGPEGGFSPDEALTLRKMRLAHAVSLGPRILRADTAAVAALTLWQSALGDWR
jgi:16S rRNA (uracil1498-N3)-methyltransferase